MVSQTDETAYSRLRTFLSLCHHFGVPVVADKMEILNCIALMGVTLDTVKMEA